MSLKFLFSCSIAKVRMKSLDPLRAKKTFIRKTEYGSDYTVSDNYRKVSTFSDARKLCSKLPKLQTKKPNRRTFCPRDANGIANSADPDQTAPV